MLAMIQMDASRKTADQPFLRDKSTISPKTVSDGENAFPRIYKKILSHDTKQPFLERHRCQKWPRAFILFSFASSYSSDIFSFSTSYFLDPPGGMSEIKKSFTLYPTLVA